MPGLAKQDETILCYMRKSLKGWRSTVEKRTQAKKWEKYVDECDELLLPEDIRHLMSSPPAVEGLKAINSAKDSVKLTAPCFTAARDLILASLSQQNGSRPGPLNNAKVRDYNTVRKEKTGKLVMLVAKHKRAQQGPTMLCMDDRLQDWLATYVNVIRPQFAQPQENALFIKTSGEAFPEATIRKRITAFYKKAGIRRHQRFLYQDRQDDSDAGAQQFC